MLTNKIISPASIPLEDYVTVKSVGIIYYINIGSFAIDITATDKERCESIANNVRKEIYDSLLKNVIAFKVWGLESTHSYDITLEKRGEDSWGVYQGERSCWDTEINWWVYESMPSSRTEESLKHTRFTFKDAVDLAHSLAKRYQKSWEEKGERWIPPQPPEELTEKIDA